MLTIGVAALSFLLSFVILARLYLSQRIFLSPLSLLLLGCGFCPFLVRFRLQGLAIGSCFLFLLLSSFSLATFVVCGNLRSRYIV
jgi:hypothetical protein